jgi:23S rRNA pseudouridine1911/1915/1917 synthase
MTEQITLAVDADHAGTRLDSLLAKQASVGSRARAQALIEAGAVTVDGRRQRKSHLLAQGQVVALTFAETAEPHPEGSDEVPYEVIYEDGYLMVVNKPPSVVVHPAPGHWTGTLAQALAGRARGGSSGRPGIVHRLDRDTSGLLIVAKTHTAHRALQALIRARKIRREYRALVEGRPQSRSGLIDAPIGRDRKFRTRISLHTDNPRSARTHFWLLEAFSGTTLLGVSLETGRTHQIRVHLAAIGHPVCGDRDYGGSGCGRSLGLGRQFLHSAKLSFGHPETGQKLCFEAPLSPDLLQALENARVQ